MNNCSAQMQYLMTVTAQPCNFSFSLTQLGLSKTASNQEMQRY